MKKFLALIICAVMLCATTFAVFAEGETPDAATPNDTVEENVPPTEENAAEGENPGEEVVPETPEETPEEVPEETPEEIPEETPTEPIETPTEPVETPTEPAPEATDPIIPEETLPVPDETLPVPEEPEVELTGPEKIVEYIKTYFEEISVIISLIVMTFYQIRKHKVLNKSIATLNNNSVTIADNSNTAMQDALAKVGGMSSTVDGYKVAMEAMLAEVRKNAEEKQRLENKLEEIDKHLALSKAANVEFANELAELLVLANIPNSKRDELYKRHLAAVDAIAEKENATVTEVNTDGIGQTE